MATTLWRWGLYIWCLQSLLLGSTVSHAQEHVQSGSTADIPVTEFPIGRRPAHQVHQDLRELFKENLQVDLQHWREKEGPMSMERVMRMRDEMKQHNFDDCLKLVLIYNNTWIFPDRHDPAKTDCPMPCNPHLELITKMMQGALARRGELHIPNVMFVVNVNDNCKRWCSQTANCSAPLFSLQKHLYGEHGMDRDILIPQMLTLPRSAYFYPWELKADKAFFRGQYTVECYKSPGFEDYVVRLWLAQRSFLEPDGKLDVGLTNGFEPPRDANGVSRQAHIPDAIPKTSSVLMKEHGRHKYLLALEGITASYRLAMLMTHNSIILKSRSPSAEYFYRSLKEGVHVTTFWNSSANDVDEAIGLLQKQAAADPQAMHRRTHQVQDFAMKYLSVQARLLYWAEALTQYKALVPDMDAYIDKLVPELIARGVNFTAPSHQELMA